MTKDDINGGRTHEPNLRELTAQLDDLKELLLAKHDAVVRIMDERDKLYTERAASGKTAVDAALKATETLTNASFASGEKANAKAEMNAEKWRENANEWRAAMIDREIKFAQRIEVDNEFKSLRAELASLKETRAEATGEKGGRMSSQQFLMMMLALVVGLITIGGAVVAVAYAIKQ